MSTEHLNQHESLPDMTPEMTDMTNLDRSLLAESIEHLEPEKELVVRILEAYRQEFQQLTDVKKKMIRWDSDELFYLKDDVLMISVGFWGNAVPDEKNNGEPTTVTAMISGIQEKTGHTLNPEMIKVLIAICNKNVHLIDPDSEEVNASELSVTDLELGVFTPAVPHKD